MKHNAEPLVSIIIPCRNESDYIESFFKRVLQQELPASCEDLEVLIADGMSDDGTREKILRIAAQDYRIKFLDNPEQIISTALNRAISRARGEIMIRMDVHSDYSLDYVKQCVDALIKTGADNVGGAARTKANGYLQKAISIAYHSPFSVGGALFHNQDYEGYVDTVTYGCWLKRTLEEIGLFDEELVVNEDDELNLRILRRGGKIWQSRSIKSWYYPRSSIRALFKQYAQYGYWKVRVIQKHKMPASLRHLVPAAFLSCLFILAVLSPFSTVFLAALALLASAYVTANLVASFVTCRAWPKIKYLPIMPFVFAAYHFGYGYGFLRGIVDFGVLHRLSGRKAFRRLTRS